MKKEQKNRIIILLVLYAAYLLTGLLLTVTHTHCRMDLPIYIAGAVLATVFVFVTLRYEAKLARKQS